MLKKSHLAKRVKFVGFYNGVRFVDLLEFSGKILDGELCPIVRACACVRGRGLHRGGVGGGPHIGVYFTLVYYLHNCQHICHNWQTDLDPI